ncbi:MAG: hypothetical protein V3V13_01310 [Paracoccaceae bacterium]
MSNHNRDAAPYSNLYKPAIQLGNPDLNQWATFFYAQTMQERFVSGNSRSSDEHLLRLGRGVSDDPTMSAIVQLKTPVAGFLPNFREVEIVGKKGYKALCVEGGANQQGVFVYLLQTLDTGNGITETHVNSRYMPFAILTDLVKGTTNTGKLEIQLPDIDLVKLNVTLCMTPAGEPEYRTHKTEVIFDNLPTAAQQTIENQLNFQSASVIAFNAFQILASVTAPSTEANAMALDVPNWAPTAKKSTVAVIVTIGTIVTIVGRAIGDATTRDVGLGLAASGVVLNYWLSIWVPDTLPAPPPQSDESSESSFDSTESLSEI